MKTAIIMMMALSVSAKRSFLWTQEQVEVAGGYRPHVVSPLPSTYIKTQDLPTDFNWGNLNGTSYLTKNLNQHIPQYCGSCWAHAAVSALADRIKIARKARGIEINLAVQHILNCGTAGSCYGGDIGMAYAWIHSQPSGVVYDTCNPYLACSSDSNEGFCGKVDTTCSASNVCRTCSTFSSSGGFCSAIDRYPNATVAEYGNVLGEEEMMKEIYARGPIGCGIDATQILQYAGGVTGGKCGGADHAISVVGWGVDAGEKYWIVRNSWGEYWGEMGYLRVSRGSGKDLCLETTSCQWATPAHWTEVNYPCNEDGANCVAHKMYIDPAHDRTPMALRKQ